MPTVSGKVLALADFGGGGAEAATGATDELAGMGEARSGNGTGAAAAVVRAAAKVAASRWGFMAGITL
jgi:hypothetical protein